MSLDNNCIHFSNQLIVLKNKPTNHFAYNNCGKINVINNNNRIQIRLIVEGFV